MIMKAKFVTEGIKAAEKSQPIEKIEREEKPRPQRPFKEVKGIQDKYYQNFEIYQEAVQRHPFVETIVEKIFHVVPNYLHQIQEDKRGVTVWCHNSCGLYFSNQEMADLLIQHRVSFQVPGNQEYTFSISINFEKEW